MVLAALLLASSVAPTAAVANKRIPVEVRSEPQEKMARRLASAVERQLKRDPRFALIARWERGAVIIALPSRVGWERRLDWTEIHYKARVSWGDGQTRVVAGHCWNWNLADCAKQIADAAAS